jgi:uncharacterized protein YjbI with pentapeptide repeats
MARWIDTLKLLHWPQSRRARLAATAACTLAIVIVGVFAGPWLRKHPGWLLLPLAVAAILVLLGCVFIFPERFVPSRPQDALKGIDNPQERIRLEDDRLKLQNDVRTALLQAFGGAAVLAGILFTWLQLQTDRDQLHNQLIITRQGQIADRFTQAVNQLGSKQPDVRLGGIYGLEAIAKQSPEARLQVFEILTAYIRKYAVRPEPPTPSDAKAKSVTSTTIVEDMSERWSDIQTALVVLSRRERMPGDPLLDLSGVDFDFPLDLTGLDLSNMNLSNSRISATLVDAHLEGADLHFASLGGDLGRVHLERANLTNASLGSILDGAYLNEANLQGADLTGARLLNDHLEKADLQDADLSLTVLEGANFKDACLNGAKLQTANLDGANLRGAVEGLPMIKGHIRDYDPTTWPKSFDWHAAGVVTRPCPIRELQ